MNEALPSPAPLPPSVVWAVVLNWNGLDLTRRCVAALSALRLPPAVDFRLLVVDNASTDHTADDLAAACPAATVLRTPSNLGFAPAIRWALDRAPADFPPYTALWLLNNDTEPAPDTLAALLTALTSDPALAAVASPLDNPPPAPGVPPPPPCPAAMRLRPPFYIPHPLPDDAPDPDYLCGASLLLSRAAIDRVGNLDPAFPFFFEDADWSFRARAAGYRLAVVPTARVLHLGSATAGKLGPRRAALYRRGHVLFLRRHARHPFLASLPPALWRILADLFSLRPRTALATAASFLRAWLRPDP